MIPGRKSQKPQDGNFSPDNWGFVQSIGLRFDRLRAEVRTVVVSFPAILHWQAPTILATAAEPLSSEILRTLRTLELDKSTLDQRDQVTHELNALAERLIQRLLSEEKDPDDILAIGCHGTGLWNASEVGQPRYSELLDSARLAESFGKTVVTSFPARDLARGGIGGPVESHGLGLLLADRDRVPGHRWRALLDLSSHTTNFTMIPGMSQQLRHASSFSMDICVGQRLLSELALRRAEAVDMTSYGKRAAAGRVIPELVQLWDATTTLDFTHSWQPDGTSVLPLIYALDQSIYNTACLEDQLASATYFLVQQIAGFALHQVPASQPVGELLVMGEGTKNQLLMRWLAESLTVIPIRKLDDLGQDRSLLAASVAALAMMHIWHIPLAASRGGEVPRVLGNITPGSPSNWQRVLQEMTSSAPWLLPLREAI